MKKPSNGEETFPRSHSPYMFRVHAPTLCDSGAVRAGCAQDLVADATQSVRWKGPGGQLPSVSLTSQTFRTPWHLKKILLKKVKRPWPTQIDKKGLEGSRQCRCLKKNTKKPYINILRNKRRYYTHEEMLFIKCVDVWGERVVEEKLEIKCNRKK